jgi:organic radical activating enzyme
MRKATLHFTFNRNSTITTALDNGLDVFKTTFADSPEDFAAKIKELVIFTAQNLSGCSFNVTTKYEKGDAIDQAVKELDAFIEERKKVGHPLADCSAAAPNTIKIEGNEPLNDEAERGFGESTTSEGGDLNGEENQGDKDSETV